jgi:hypothetical protein
MAQTRSMTLLTAILAVAAVTVLSGHVAPSVDDNNRYVKVTPMAGGARLAYTVFFGEVPGAAERRLLDTNRDGRIDPAEAKVFGDKLASEIAANLDVDSAGRSTRVTWSVVDVGLGNDAVAAGSFSVDMIAYLCASEAAGTTHRVHLRDSFRIPRPGETEVKVDDSPGVTVSRASIGGADDPRHDYRFVGAGGPLTDDGLTVEWTTTAQAPLLPPGTCAASTTGDGGRRGGRGWLLPGIAVAVLAAGATGLALFRRRARVS